MDFVRFRQRAKTNAAWPVVPGDSWIRSSSMSGNEKFSLIPKDTFNTSVFARDCRNLVWFGYSAIVIGMAGLLVYLIVGQPAA